MIEKELISIILPIFNVEQYLPKCLDSIANQTYKNFEVFLVDDGSTDGSGKICDEFSLKDKRFKTIHQANSGISAARNVGLALASGEYITFADGDDYLHPQMLETLLQTAKQTGCELSMVGCKRVYGNNTQEEIKIGIMRILNQEEIICNIFEMKTPDEIKILYPVWNKLYHKKLIKDIRFNNVVSQDLDFNLRIFMILEKIGYNNTPLYYYFQRSDSISRYNPNRVINVYSGFLFYLRHIPQNKHSCRAHYLRYFLKNLMCIRYDMKGTKNEGYANKRLKDVREKGLKEFLKNPKVSIFEKVIMALFLKIPCTYRLFRWVMEQWVLINQKMRKCLKK